MKLMAGTAVLVFLTAIAGCGDKNPVGPNSLQSKYFYPGTPEAVLENLRLAYTTRDIAAYNSLFHASYTGSSIDNTDPSPTLLTFTKADEARHIGALASSATILSIYLSFGRTQIRFTSSADSVAGLTSVQTTDPILEVNSVSTSLVLRDNVTMEFKFIPRTPARGSPTDTAWTIVRWTEIAN